MPDARAKLIAAGVPESGMGRTRSAPQGASAARRSPMRTAPHAPRRPRAASRPRQVEELEDAERAVRTRDGLARVQAVLVDDHQLAALHLALELCADEVERAGLGRHHPVAVEAADAEWTEAVRVAEGNEPTSLSATTE